MNTDLATLVRETRNLYYKAMEVSKITTDNYPDSDAAKELYVASTQLICAAASLQRMIDQLGSAAQLEKVG